MDNEITEITHPKFRIWLRPDGVIHLVWAERVTTGLEDARAATDAMAQLTGGRQSPLMVDTHNAGPQDRPARIEFTRRHDLVSAVALLVSNPLGRMLGHFYLTVSKPIAPTRLFEDEASALAWLKEFAE